MTLRIKLINCLLSPSARTFDSNSGTVIESLIVNESESDDKNESESGHLQAFDSNDDVKCEHAIVRESESMNEHEQDCL